MTFRETVTKDIRNTFHIVVDISLPTAALKILASVDGPEASGCQHQTHKTSWLYTKKWNKKKSDPSVQILVFRRVKISRENMEKSSIYLKINLNGTGQCMVHCPFIAVSHC